MPGWDQAVAGQRLYSDSDPTDVLLDDVDDSVLLSDSDIEGWNASGLAKTAGVATFVQDASWEAVGSQELEGAAGWSQDATWAALGQSAEDVTGEAAWEQSGSSWLAASSQVVVGSATFEQTAIWAAEGQSSVEEPAPEPEPEPETPSRPHGVRISPAQGAVRRQPPRITGRASFEQEPADWYAYATVNDDALVLVLV